MFRIILIILGSYFIAPELLAMDFPPPKTGSSNIRSPRRETPLRRIESWLSGHGFHQGLAQNEKRWSTHLLDLRLSLTEWLMKEGIADVMKREDAPQIYFWGMNLDGVNSPLWCEKYDLKQAIAEFNLFGMKSE